MSSKTLRILLIAAVVLVAFAVVTSAYAQDTTGTATATPGTLPTTGGVASPTSTAAVVLLALGATAGLGGLLLRGLRQPR